MGRRVPGSAPPRLVLLLALAVGLSAGLLPGTANAASGADTPRAAGLPEDHPERGLVYRGLRPARADGPCRGHGYEVADTRGETSCTHGPDVAPAGVDVRERRSTAEIAADAAGSAAAQGTALTCIGDGVSGPRVQAVYARASNVTSRYSSVLASIRSYAAQMDADINASAAQTGGTRHIRWVTDASCQPTVLNVTLSTAGDDDVYKTRDELRAQGYNRTDRKYVVWMDANVYCGIGFVENDDSAGSTNRNNGIVQGMVARADNQCWGSVESHELMHTLGGVQLSAPHTTGLWHCWDEWDKMCYADGGSHGMIYTCGSDMGRLFDCGHDDYFHTNPPAGSYLATHWNTARSSFLDASETPPPPPPPSTQTLTVSRSGAGTGTITSVPAGINCGTDCTQSYTSGTVVTLTSLPSPGSVLSGWSGACTGLPVCVVTMSIAKSVTATFGLGTPPPPPPPPPPTGTVVTMTDLGYTPTIVKPAQGTAVTWSFTGLGTHGVIDNNGMALYSSGAKPAGSTFAFTFSAAGTYNYKDPYNTLLTGQVKVPMKVTPASGTTATPVTVRWASMATFAPWAFDVQIRRPGGLWVTFRTAVTYAYATFTPDSGTGTYSFRSRLRNTSTGAATGYSAAGSITVS